jgi:hypothetical protein
MSKTVIIPVAELHTRVAAIQGDLETIQTTLQEKLSTGGAQAQTSRLVAFALAKQAAQLLPQLNQSVSFLEGPDEAAAEATAKLPATGNELFDGLFSAVAKLAEGVAAMVSEQFGVEEAAVGPFILETACVFLPIVEQMVSTAKEKLAEADQIIEG